MRVAVSNIAWERPEDEPVAALLRHFALDAIDLVPGKYFVDLQAASDGEIDVVRHWWLDRGISITGMQALLFGTTGLNMFGPPSSRQAMLQHLRAICRIAGRLNATRLVFGSPRNRDRSGLSDSETADLAVSFFRELGDVAASHGVLICLEPNPTRYGANFMCTSSETAGVVIAVDHPAIRMQLDTGSLVINAERPDEVLRDFAPLISHIHASEPDLVPLGDGGTDHGVMASFISKFLPDHVVSIEMVATKSEPHLLSIERAVRVALNHYRGADEGIAS